MGLDLDFYVVKDTKVFEKYFKTLYWCNKVINASNVNLGDKFAKWLYEKYIIHVNKNHEECVTERIIEKLMNITIWFGYKVDKDRWQSKQSKRIEELLERLRNLDNMYFGASLGETYHYNRMFEILGIDNDFNGWFVLDINAFTTRLNAFKNSEFYKKFEKDWQYRVERLEYIAQKLNGKKVICDISW